jgi:hypothetical protein
MHRRACSTAVVRKTRVNEIVEIGVTMDGTIENIGVRIKYTRRSIPTVIDSWRRRVIFWWSVRLVVVIMARV